MAERFYEPGRLEAFSDGVFAIAITLLVIEIKVPQPNEVTPPRSSRSLYSWRSDSSPSRPPSLPSTCRTLRSAPRHAAGLSTISKRYRWGPVGYGVSVALALVNVWLALAVHGGPAALFALSERET